MISSGPFRKGRIGSSASANLAASRLGDAARHAVQSELSFAMSAHISSSYKAHTGDHGHRPSEKMTVAARGAAQKNAIGTD